MDNLIGWGLIACGAGLIAAAGLMVRYAKLPPWSHKDLLAFLALVGTIGGAVILTVLKNDQVEHFNHHAERLINELVRERQGAVHESVGESLNTIIDALAWDHKLSSVGIIVVLLSLGLVISARTLKGKFLGGEFEMGGAGHEAAARAAAAAGAAETAEAAVDRAHDIAQAGAVAEIVDAAPTARQ